METWGMMDLPTCSVIGEALSARGPREGAHPCPQGLLQGRCPGPKLSTQVQGGRGLWGREGVARPGGVRVCRPGAV